ncbi:MAG: 16S rRNA (guanine(966)-N(2))-methyltransferase RsmD [Candidatus Izemoplasma sp.]
MRVIAGEFRSRIIKEVGILSTRETKDLVKESIFNSIGPNFIDRNVLDLFAGSGSLGIEALSRGASSCVFVDNNKYAIKTINQNLHSLKLTSNIKVVLNEYAKFLNNLDQKFDIILLDPPYDLEVIELIIETVSKKKILADNGVIVVLTSKKSLIKDQISDIIKYKEKVKGITKISFWEWGF